jgi:hypothetical protein
MITRGRLMTAIWLAAMLAARFDPLQDRYSRR